MTQKKKEWLVLLLVWGIIMTITGVIGVCYGATMDGPELSEPIEFTVASQYYRGDGTLFLTASEFESPRFYIEDSGNRRVVEKSVCENDKISVRVYDYDRGYGDEFLVGELYKDGETVFSDVVSGRFVREVVIFSGIVLGTGVLLSVLCGVLIVKEKHKNDNSRNHNE